MQIAWPKATAGKDDIRGRGCLRNYSNAVRKACGVVLRCRREGGGWCAIAAPRNRRRQQRDCIRINERGTRRRTDFIDVHIKLLVISLDYLRERDFPCKHTIAHTTITLSNSFPNHAAPS
jgi:hypothetical protein